MKVRHRLWPLSTFIPIIACPILPFQRQSFADLQQHNYARVNGLCYPDGPSDVTISKSHTVRQRALRKPCPAGFAPPPTN
jgi:hypothetical protein